MPAILFVGDAVSAAGWRLAGVETWVADRGEEAELLTRASRPPTQLLLMTTAVAHRLPPPLQRRLFASVTPLVLVVPDLLAHEEMPDLAVTVRKQLGMEQ